MLLHADSFEHYGTAPNGGRDAMLAGMWTQMDNDGSGNYSISSEQARTGSKSLKFTPGASGGASNARFSMGGAPKITCGLASGLFLTSLPTTNDRLGYQFRDNTNTALLTIAFQSDGSITAHKGGITGPVIDVSDTILQSGTFNHIETKAVFDNVAGSVQVRVNSQTKLLIGSLDLGLVGCAQCSFMSFSGRDCPVFYWDDPFAWDDTGTYNNDLIGAQRILTNYGNADTAQADWSLVGAGSGYACIDDVTPDYDATYIGASTVGNKSDFTLPTLPPETASIAAVFIPLLAKLDAAGVGNVKPSLKSGASLAAGTDTPLTPGYTYYKNVFEVDPATGLPWTKAGLEAALLRIEKTL